MHSLVPAVIGGVVALAQPPAPLPPPAPPPQAGQPVIKDRAARWREDLALLVEELPKRHKNLFARVSREDWLAAAAALEKKLPELTDWQSYLELTRLVAMVGDAHTTVGLSSAFRPRQMPIFAAKLSDGMFIIATDEAHRDLLGARLVKVGGMDGAEVLARVGALVSADNDVWRTRQALPLVSQADPLAWAGVPGEGKGFMYDVVLAGGEARSVTLEPMAAGARIAAFMPDPKSEKLISTRRPREEWSGFEILPGSRDLYAWYDRCQDQPNKRTVAQFCEALVAAIDEQKPERVIFDLRRNAGGNSALLAPLVNTLLQREDLRRPGFVYVLTGQTTFSSGMMNALQLKRAGATLAGGPTGGKPNAFGEVRSFELPNWRLPVQYSTKLFRQIADSDPPSVMPDVPDQPSSKEFFDETRDTTIEAVRKHKP